MNTSPQRKSPLPWLAAVVAVVIIGLLGWRLLGADGVGTEPSATDDKPERAGLRVGPREHARERVDLKLVPKASISGTVQDPERRPIAGARVCAFPDGQELRGAGDENEPRCSLSGADGHYRIEGLWPVHATVHASAPNYKPNSWHLREDDGDLRDDLELHAGELVEAIDITLEPGGALIRGVVKDISGGEIEGAQVSSHGRTLGLWIRAVSFTDEAGVFELWVDPGVRRITAISEGYARGSAEAVAPGEFVELFLTPESVLVGRVVLASNGEGVAGVTVSTRNSGGVQTDESGKFRIAGLEPGIYKPIAMADDLYGETVEQVHLGLGQTSDMVEIRVHPAALVVGHILVAGSKAPCEQGNVTLTRRDEDHKWGRVQHHDGRVEFRGVVPGSYEVKVECAGHIAEDEYPELVVTEAGVDELVWEVREGLAIRGEVVDDQGEPVAEIDLQAAAVRGEDADARAKLTSGRGQSKLDGSFEFTGLLPGRYEVSTPGWGDTARPGMEAPIVVELESGADRNDLRVVLPASGQLRGRIIDEQGVPVSGANIRAELIDGQGRASTRSDDAGAFTFEHLRPGQTRVSASDDGRWWGGTNMRKPGTSDEDLQGEVVTVSAQATAEVELVVESRGGVIRGTVRDEGGGPVADAFIDVDRMLERAGTGSASARQRVRWSWSNQPVLSSHDGSFELQGLPDGEFIIRAHRKGGGEAVAEHVTLGSEVELIIASTGELAGVVLLADGSAPERFTLLALDAAAGVRRRDRYFRSEGQWRLRELPAGSYKLSANAGAGNVELEIELGEGEIREDIELRLAPRLTIRGRLVDLDTREPVVGLEVHLSTSNSWTSGKPGGERRNVSDANGRFELTDAPSGMVRLMAWNRGGGEDAKYEMLWHAFELDAEPLVQDIGELEVVARRLAPREEAGDIGFTLHDWDPTLEPEEREAVVAFVRPGGPAAATSLQTGDVIETVDGHDVIGPNFPRYGVLTRAPVGTTLELVVRGRGKVTITLGPPL